jgi:hypothetical protein
MEQPQPTAADFAALDERARAFDAMDPATLKELQTQMHEELPSPYGNIVASLDLTESDVVRALHDVIKEDPVLSPEERYALTHEIDDRSRAAVLATAPEGWND